MFLCSTFVLVLSNIHTSIKQTRKDKEIFYNKFFSLKYNYQIEKMIIYKMFM